MSRKFTQQYADSNGSIIEKPGIGILLAAGTTVPTDATAGFAPGCIFQDTDASAGSTFYVNNGTATSCAFDAVSTTGGSFAFDDDAVLGLGTGSTARLSYDTTDANANELLLQLPAGGAVDVPVLVIGQSIESVDLGLYNGVVDPRVAILSSGAVTTGPVIEMRKARGTSAAPTVVTSGDDIGQVDFYGCVAAGEYVRGASIQADMAGTIATTRGPGTLTFKTATDAAPSVLTTALTISAAQLVTCAAGLTVTTGTVTVSSGDVTITSGDINLTAASDIDIAANTAAALEVDDGTTKIVAVDTRNTLKDIDAVTITGVPVTVASETAAHRNASLHLAAKTITYTGTTGTTSSNGCMLYVGVPTVTDADMMTITTVSSVFINAVAAAGGMLTISNSYMIHTSVSGCFLTNAGVWTDMACWEAGKEFVERGVDKASAMIERVLGRITPATWKYKAMTELPAIDEDGNPTIHRTPIRDKGRERVGIVYDDLPEELRAPGEETAVSTGVLSSFALAAIKMLHERNQDLESRLAKLEAV